MKVSPFLVLITKALAQEEDGLNYDYLTDVSDEIDSLGMHSNANYEYDYYYDALGNKKKKKKNKNKNNNYYPVVQQSAYQPPKTNTYAAAPAASWAPSNSWGASNNVAKGFEWSNDKSPLIGNGRFCWNCYARTDSTGSAYYNCFNGVQRGFLEMCTGEEYFCMWNERRHEGRVTEVGGGCKADHACLVQMMNNFMWESEDNSLGKRITGNLCRAGQNKNVGIAFEDSVCTWCCDGMVTNRFAPTEADLCNFKTTTSSPAYEWAQNGSTDNFMWFSENNKFAGLYQDGQYHRIFMIAIQTAIGDGILSTP